MASELLPCPFCGGKPDTWQTDGRDQDDNDVVGCTDCGARGSAFYWKYKDSKEKAIEAWNRRVPNDAERKLKEAMELLEKVPVAFQVDRDGDIYNIGDNDEWWKRYEALKNEVEAKP